jgi:protein-S-isoprenylcysteine O-methyltransferase Ste14
LRLINTLPSPPHAGRANRNLWKPIPHVNRLDKNRRSEDGGSRPESGGRIRGFELKWSQGFADSDSHAMTLKLPPLDSQAAFLSLVTLAWLVFEVQLVSRDRRKGVAGTKQSHGESLLLMLAMAAGLGAALNISSLESLSFPGGKTFTVFFSGLGIMLLGFGLRLWAIRTLGKFFRTTLQVDQGQQVVNRGPYRLVRHPSYAGALLICAGLGIALQNWLSLASAVLLPLMVYVYRIGAEEKMLIDALGQEYLRYREHTKKLIPWVW